MLNWTFLLSFLQKCLICEMKCRNRIITVCKQAYRNLKLQTYKPLYLVGPQNKILSAETMNGLPFLRNIKLSSTVHGHIRYVPFSNLFSKNLSFWRRGCSDYICLYSNQTPLPLFSLCLCPTLMKARVIVVGDEQNRPAPKDNPCSFILGVDFLRGEGLVGIFFRKTPLPIWFAGWPPFGNTGGGPFLTNPRINSDASSTSIFKIS